MAKGNAPQVTGDRIAMPSIAKDGNWDQTDPSIVGDVDAAKEAAGYQAAVRATSIVDDAVRTNPDEAPEFTSIDDLQKQQEAAAEAARKAAEAEVASLAENTGDSGATVSTTSPTTTQSAPRA